MKRIFALLLTMAMLLSITACGDNKKAEKKPTTTASIPVTTAPAIGTTTQGGSTSTEDTTTTAGTTPSVTVPSSTQSTGSTMAPTTTTTPTTTAPTKPVSKAKLNGVSLSEYTIVIDDEALDYADRAATYIRNEIRTRTGAELSIVTDDTTPTKHEIVVGETSRPISKSLNEKTTGLQVSMMAKDGHVAMEGDYFIIAAAAYYFVDTYITGKTASTTVSTKALVREPIVKKANNYIFLIGDGMGINHTLLPNEYDLSRFDRDEVDANNFTDNENFFYGYLFPNQGAARTHNIHGAVTDSAASATALATGYKTNNGRVGMDQNKNKLKSLTELAGDLGMNTAVMTTEGQSGATPGGFSAHVPSRDMYDEIEADQAALTEKYGTIINSKYDYYNGLGINHYL